MNLMTNTEFFIVDSEKLTNIFGRWPSFHDAEALELHLSRGKVSPAENFYLFPILTLKFHLWEMTKEVNADGYIVLKNHTLATLKFCDVSKLRLEGFNHQNAIFGIHIDRLERTEPPSPYFSVTLAPCYGIDASFECLGIEVAEAVPCTEQGDPI
jgi:hypothetical protein